jgi:hypothetical protein
LQLRYLHDVLHHIATDADYEPAGWDAAEVAHFLLVAQCADAASATQDLLTLRLLRLRPDADGAVASVSLSAVRMLTIKFESTATSMSAVFDTSMVETGKR